MYGYSSLLDLVGFEEKHSLEIEQEFENIPTLT